MTLIIEAFDKWRHERKLFDCGISELNDYLRNHASQNQQNNMSKIFVAITDDLSVNPTPVQGYYTLSAGNITWNQLPDNVSRRLPKYPIPIARIGRLARDINYKGTGLGGFLLHDALTRVLSIADGMGIFVVVVDAKYGAKQFYIDYGFEPLNDNELTFFSSHKNSQGLLYLIASMLPVKVTPASHVENSTIFNYATATICLL